VLGKNHKHIPQMVVKNGDSHGRKSKSPSTKTRVGWYILGWSPLPGTAIVAYGFVVGNP